MPSKLSIRISAREGGLFWAGAANTTCVRLILKSRSKPENIVVCDSRGGYTKAGRTSRADKNSIVNGKSAKTTNPKK